MIRSLRLPLLAVAAALVIGACGTSRGGGEPRCEPGAACGRGHASGDSTETPAEPGPSVLAEDATAPAPAPRARRVLFVGNSYTSFNGLPQVVRALGEATAGSAVDVESVLVDGATLAQHWTSTGARARVEGGHFDTVVLQGQSVEPIGMSESFHHHGDLFTAAVKASGARGVWFATWARRAGDPLYTTSSLTPDSMTKELEYRYAMVARPNEDGVARVGAAWKLAQTELPDVGLFAPDGSHPSAAGSLLSACVILQAITGQAPRVPHPPPLGLGEDTAKALCALAPRVQCLEGKAPCDGRCVDLTQDAQNCGACGVHCAAGDPCQGGVCGCDAGLKGCGGTCYDTQSSAFHCGTCGNRCDAGTVCRAGACACPKALALDVDISALAARRPACATWNDAASPACAAAAHEHCRSLGCFQSGFGPPSGHAPQPHAVACVAGDVRSTTYGALKSLVPGCDAALAPRGQACTTAIHRHCVAAGSVSGFGPVETGGATNDRATVTCVAEGAAVVVATTLTVLATQVSRCTPDPVTCTSAAWNFCTSQGHLGGFGPVETSGNDAKVTCFLR